MITEYDPHLSAQHKPLVLEGKPGPRAEGSPPAGKGEERSSPPPLDRTRRASCQEGQRESRLERGSDDGGEGVNVRLRVVG